MSTGNVGAVLGTEAGIGFKRESAIYDPLPRRRLPPVTDTRPYGIRAVEERQQHHERNHARVDLPVRPKPNLD
jgi:hypothetical protein